MSIDWRKQIIYWCPWCLGEFKDDRSSPLTDRPKKCPCCAQPIDWDWDEDEDGCIYDYPIKPTNPT